MDSIVIAALIGVGGVIAGAVLREVLPGSKVVRWLSGQPARHSLVGDWTSSWGPLPVGPAKYHERLTVTRQRGDRIWGVIKRDEEAERQWEFEGRYDGQFLQLFYFPSDASRDSDFLNHGCYFFRRKADGSFEGYSTGFGEYEEDVQEGITTDYHELRRR